MICAPRSMAALQHRQFFFNISKAFDRVWHKGLLVKLEAAGIRGQLLEWFRDYMTNPMQTAVIKGEKPCVKRVMSGVPRGSVLGLLLFLIYINDIVNDIPFFIKLFVHDTNLSLRTLEHIYRIQI